MKKFVASQILLPALIIVVGILAQPGYSQPADEYSCPCHNRFLLVSIMEPDSADSVDSVAVALKSPSTALTHSLIGTLVPLPTIVLTFPGIIFGPSLGYFYADMSGRAWTGIGLRAVGVGGMASSFVICGWDCGPGQKGYDAAWAVFIAGGALAVGSAIYDLATVKPNVRKHNDRIKSGPNVSFGLRYYADARAAGIGIALTF